MLVVLAAFNAHFSVSSAQGLLAPTMLTNPFSVTVPVGGSITLSVSASGSDLSYQWAFNSSA